MIFDSLPHDPIILFSFVNTKLRDDYPSLEELCEVYDVKPEEIKARLATAGYVYDERQNRFI